MACCIPTAHAKARLGLRNTTIKPSPRFFTSPASRFDGPSQQSEVCLAKRVGLGSAHRRGQLGRADEVGEEERRGYRLARFNHPRRPLKGPSTRA